MKICRNLFTKTEIEKAIFQIVPLKSLGPDGFGAIFYQSYWMMVGDWVYSTVLDFLNGGTLRTSANSTYLPLISMVQNPSFVNEFRSISICNILYTIIAKTLANRLKKLLPSIILMNQSAFIPKRLIMNNIIVAYEALHSIKSRKWGKVGNIAIKFNISKAYDRV